MQTIEVARWYLPPRPGRKSRHASTWLMTREEAAALGAVDQVPGTAQAREIPETDSEQARSMVQYQSAGRDAVKPPPT